MYYLNENGDYVQQMYEGSAPESWTAVPKRPDQFYDYDADTNAWVLNADRQNEVLSEDVRAERDYRLRYMDKQLANPIRWNSLTDDKKAEWTTYRQELLDVPQQSGFPLSVTWPTKPEA